MNLKERSRFSFKPADLNATILIKIVSDWAAVLKKISPFSSLVFILINFQKIISNKKAIITALFFIPALIITPSFDILRFVFTVFVFWIFLKKLDDPDTKYSSIVAAIISIYVIVIFAGIFDTSLYAKMEHYRYRFILESHNALNNLVFFFFVYQVNYFLERKEGKNEKWINILVFISIILLCIIFLFIKGRLYLTLTFVLVSILAFKNFRRFKLFAAVPVLYVIFFLGITQFRLVIGPTENKNSTISNQSPATNKTVIPADTTVFSDTAKKIAGTKVRPGKVKKKIIPPDTIKTIPSVVKIDTPSKKSEADEESIKAEEARLAVDNKRLFSLSGTGRERMWITFIEFFRDSGWKKFIYQNNTKPYLERKSKLPDINIHASTLTENSYLITLLSTGYIGLLVFFYIFFHYFRLFFKKRAYLSLLFFLLLMAIWFYEEAVIFPFSMISHLFALMSVYRFEMKKDETSYSNKHASSV